MIWTLPAVLILSATIWFANGIRKIGAVSSGGPIGVRAGTALLMIDLQPAFWDAGTYSETAKAEAKAHVLDEVNAAKSSGIPVIAVRHEWSIPSTKAVAKLLGKGLAIEGTQGTEVLAPFNELADHTIVKRVQDGFETKELDNLLQQMDVGKLIIVGLDASFCVAKTALGARRRGYEVEIVRQGVLAASQQKSEKTFKLLRQNLVTFR